MSGPKHFEVRVTLTAAERLRQREESRMRELRRATDDAIARLKALTQSVTEAEQARRPALTTQVTEMAEIIQRVSAATFTSITAPHATHPVSHPGANTLRQAYDARESIASVAHRITQEVQRDANAAIEREAAVQRRRSIASEIAAALGEMGFAVRTDERQPSPSAAAAPMIVAARGSEQIRVRVDASGLVTDWKDKPGAPCDTSVRDLSARLKERGIEMSRTDDGGGGAAAEWKSGGAGA